MIDRESCEGSQRLSSTLIFRGRTQGQGVWGLALGHTGLCIPGGIVTRDPSPSACLGFSSSAGSLVGGVHLPTQCCHPGSPCRAHSRCLENYLLNECLCTREHRVRSVTVCSASQEESQTSIKKCPPFCFLNGKGK